MKKYNIGTGHFLRKKKKYQKFKYIHIMIT